MTTGRFRAGLAFGSAAALMSVAWEGAAAQAPIELVDVASDGTRADHGGGFEPGAVISADGRWVVFESASTNLSSIDGGGWNQVFVHDRTSGATLMLSVNTSGVAADEHCNSTTISGSGRFVAFDSFADNLVDNDTNSASDIFVVDRDPDGNGTFDEGNATFEKASVGRRGGQANSSSLTPSLSDDGRFVGFVSYATNLVENDTNGLWDAFVRDRRDAVTIRVSVASDGTEANDETYGPCRICGDGTTAAFTSFATNLGGRDNNRPSCFVHELGTGMTELVSVNSDGVPGNDQSRDATISADGNVVAFVSNGSNLDDADDSQNADVFVRDRAQGTTRLVSYALDGTAMNGAIGAFLSADGRRVIFDTSHSQIVANDFNSMSDAFVRDLATQTTICASVNCMGIPAGGVGTGCNYRCVSLSADGRFAVFVDDASDLVDGDPNSLMDVFVNDLTNPGDVATASNYGDGYPGTLGVPTLTSSVPPAFDASGTLMVGNSQGSWTLAFLLLGPAESDQQTNDGGKLLVSFSFIVPLLVPPYDGTLDFHVPFDASLCGATAYCQAIELDSGATHGLSFTPGLALHVGR